MSMFFKRKDIQVSIVVLCFLAVFIPYFFKIEVLGDFADKLVTITSLINASALALAVHALFRRSLNTIRQKRRGWWWSIYMLSCLIAMVIFGLMGQDSVPWRWSFLAIINPLSSVNYCILAFYLSSACARAFRARSIQSTLLLIAGFICLFYQAPLTEAYFPGIQTYAEYVRSTFGVAVSRSITMGLTVASIILGVRMLTGREVSFLGFGSED